jgi:low affinity Fe/Cu permease
MSQKHKPSGTSTKSWAVQAGDHMSELVSRLFAHPYLQIGVILFCAAWFLIGFQVDLLTAALSILAITLTQMVLNTQFDREADAHRRDVAMHAKIDELVIALKGARNEMAGIEELEEDEIAELKEEVVQAIDRAGEKAGDAKERAAAKRAAATAVQREVDEARAKTRKRTTNRS